MVEYSDIITPQRHKKFSNKITKVDTKGYDADDETNTPEVYQTLEGKFLKRQNKNEQQFVIHQWVYTSIVLLNQHK